MNILTGSPSKYFIYIFTATYTVLGMILHVEVSKLAVGKYKQITGDFIPRQHSVEVSLIVLIIVILFFLYKFFKGTRRKSTLIFLSLYIIVLILFYEFFSLHPVEIIHLIQYSTVAYLIGLCIDPDRKKFYFSQLLLITGGLGIIDELMQYYIVAPGHTYLDFNDFLVNVLGAIAGCLIFYGFRIPHDHDPQRIKPFYLTRRFTVLSVSLLTVISLNLLGYLQQTPPYNMKIKPGSIMRIDGQPIIFMERVSGKLGNWLEHFVEGYYYALTPIEGILLILGLYFIFSLFDPRMFSQLGIKNKKILEFFND